MKQEPKNLDILDSLDFPKRGVSTAGESTRFVPWPDWLAADLAATRKRDSKRDTPPADPAPCNRQAGHNLEPARVEPARVEPEVSAGANPAPVPKRDVPPAELARDKQNATSNRSEHATAATRADSPPWPVDLAGFCLLLHPGDLPGPFDAASGVRVAHPDRWLAALQRDARHGPRGPRARYGALQRDLRLLRDVVLEEADKRQAACQTN